MTVLRKDNVGVVVEDIGAAIEFFSEHGLALKGHGRLELTRFDSPAIASDHRTAPVNSSDWLKSSRRGPPA
ncbi:MAG: hypothetical protein IPM94_13100 [bacterium]|nr:hypothetical protein [bacterium]